MADNKINLEKALTHLNSEISSTQNLNAGVSPSPIAFAFATQRDDKEKSEIVYILGDGNNLTGNFNPHIRLETLKNKLLNWVEGTNRWINELSYRAIYALPESAITENQIFKPMVAAEKLINNFKKHLEVLENLTKGESISTEQQQSLVNLKTDFEQNKDFIEAPKMIADLLEVLVPVDKKIFVSPSVAKIHKEAKEKKDKSEITFILSDCDVINGIANPRNHLELLQNKLLGMVKTMTDHISSMRLPSRFPELYEPKKKAEAFIADYQKMLAILETLGKGEVISAEQHQSLVDFKRGFEQNMARPSVTAEMVGNVLQVLVQGTQKLSKCKA